MAPITQTIANLLGGVSQQPDPLKLPGQVRESINTYLDPTFGCKKRPPTKFIANLSTDVPADAKWFPIFLANNERYAATIYKNPGLYVRVWNLISGAEVTVSVSTDAGDYLANSTASSISSLSLADYTLIANSNRKVTMSTNSPSSAAKEALVVVEQVTYNTTYSIDLSKDGSVATTKVYRATKLEVVPGSYEEDDSGLCTANSAQDHTVASGAKTGLSFRLVNQCAAYYDASRDDYVSRYNCSVILLNGGVGWRAGDTVSVTQSGKTFKIRVLQDTYDYAYASDGSVSYTTPTDVAGGALTLASVVSNLTSSVSAKSGYSAESVGNCIWIYRDDARDFNLSCRGGAINSYMKVIKGVANDISDLPTQCFPGITVKVKNTSNAGVDDYYVVFRPNSEGVPGAGVWEETAAADIPSDFNTSTMPHALVREADGTFSLKPLDATTALGGWAGRSAGDDITAPVPSFVDRSITNMFFFRNRLGFLSEDAVIMSQPGDYFNFFTASALAVSDADPIDMTASSAQPAILKRALGTDAGLLLFAENAQFLMSSDDGVFSTNTAKIKEVSNYAYRSNVEPQNTGMSIIYPTSADSYTKVFEMSIASLEDRAVIAENTRIIPEYIPTGLTWSAASVNNSMALFGNDSQYVWTFKYFNVGNERQLAGWTKWKLPGPVVLFACDSDDNYLVCKNGTRHILLKQEMLDSPAEAVVSSSFGDFTPRLDHYTKKAGLTAVLSGSNYKVYFPTGSWVTGATAVLINASGTYEGTFSTFPTAADGTGTYVLISSDLYAEDFVLGLTYRYEVVLPAFFVKGENSTDRVDIPIVEELALELYQSGRYQAVVRRFGYDDYSVDLDVTTADVYIPNYAAAIEEFYTSKAPIYCKGSEVQVTIFSDDPLPSSITGYSWRGHYTKRGVNQI
jgi:hypothetical protein